MRSHPPCSLPSLQWPRTLLVDRPSPAAAAAARSSASDPLGCLSCDHRSLCYECTAGHIRARIGRGYDAAVEAIRSIGCTPDPDYLAYQAARELYVRGYRENLGTFRSGFIESEEERRVREPAMDRSRARLTVRESLTETLDCFRHT